MNPCLLSGLMIMIFTFIRWVETTTHCMESFRHTSLSSPILIGRKMGGSSSQIVVLMNFCSLMCKKSAKLPVVPLSWETKNGPLTHANSDGGFKASSHPAPVEITSMASTETIMETSLLQETTGDLSTCTEIQTQREPNAKHTEPTQATLSESCSIKLTPICTQLEAMTKPSWNGRFADLNFIFNW